MIGEPAGAAAAAAETKFPFNGTSPRPLSTIACRHRKSACRSMVRAVAKSSVIAEIA
jgi:hypothetical protein